MKIIKSVIENFFKFFGYQITLEKITKIHKIFKNSGLNLNIGAGDYHITNFVSLDFKNWTNKKDNLFVLYDIRKDKIPYDDNTIDNIYISHVMEHLEDIYISKVFRESFRVLKKNGVLRISVPDAKFLFNVSLFDNAYWTWRTYWFNDENHGIEGVDLQSIKQEEYFIKEIATPKSKYYKNRIKDKSIKLELDKNKYTDILEELVSDLNFRDEFPGDHINYWDFNKVFKLGNEIGFKHIVESKYQGSISEKMRTKEFDLKAPMMSLYVDLVK